MEAFLLRLRRSRINSFVYQHSTKSILVLAVLGQNPPSVLATHPYLITKRLGYFLW